MYGVSYSVNILLISLIHFLSGVAFGICPWFRPWNLAAGIGYILIKELFWDPIRIAGVVWWELEPDHPHYRWGRGLYQVLELREKCSIDMDCYFLGMSVGAILHAVIF